MSSTFTSDFRQEFEQERERWLRKRLLWYLGLSIVISLIAGAGALVAVLTAEKMTPALRDSTVLSLVLTGLGLTSYIWAARVAWRRLLTREQTVRMFSILFVLNGVLGLVAPVASFEIARLTSKDAAVGVAAPGVGTFSFNTTTETQPGEKHDPADPDEQATAGGAPAAERDAVPETARRKSAGSRFVVFGALGGMFISHLLACLFLPLTPRESFAPLAPLLALSVGLSAVYWPGAGWFGLLVTLAALTGVPGAAVCYWRQGRFRERFHNKALRRRYGEMKQELTDARRIHEALFAKPVLEGAVRMDFRYEPMRQIGGDYLFARFSPSARGPRPVLSVVLMDVTGHGIPAALTVNRLHGELERLYAERPDAGPGDILQSLNRYVHLTLASHSVYVTALCVRVDPNPGPDPSASGRVLPGAIDWASGGHPPAFLRGVDGTIHMLDSTAFVLGACHGDDFQHGQRIEPFGPGDRLILYTDGAIEARNREGRMLRIEGFLRIVSGLKPAEGASLAPEILRAVEHFRFGPPADDTLVVEISRPVGL